MDDFDDYLETELRLMLDPVVATPAPSRTGPGFTVRRPIRAVDGPTDRTAEVIPIAEPVTVAVQAAAPPL